ncbi:hypothetical protein [Kitasatospora sp. CB01950]|uniref:hypothetical protein n=1 Tax=Kitasatospora sp. CB01950 TaxID=1703930 RepID=UPI0018E9601D|nr:hypothetical protein [Kitasatospora sp. CB01950]
METSTAQPPQGDTLVADAEFDLVIGELEQGAPAHQQSTWPTCTRIYCSPEF